MGKETFIQFLISISNGNQENSEKALQGWNTFLRCYQMVHMWVMCDDQKNSRADAHCVSHQPSRILMMQNRPHNGRILITLILHICFVTRITGMHVTWYICGLKHELCSLRIHRGHALPSHNKIKNYISLSLHIYTCI